MSERAPGKYSESTSEGQEAEDSGSVLIWILLGCAVVFGRTTLSKFSILKVNPTALWEIVDVAEAGYVRAPINIAIGEEFVSVQEKHRILNVGKLPSLKHPRISSSGQWNTEYSSFSRDKHESILRDGLTILGGHSQRRKTFEQDVANGNFVYSRWRVARVKKPDWEQMNPAWEGWKRVALLPDRPELRGQNGGTGGNPKAVGIRCRGELQSKAQEQKNSKTGGCGGGESNKSFNPILRWLGALG